MLDPVSLEVVPLTAINTPDIRKKKPTGHCCCKTSVAAELLTHWGACDSADAVACSSPHPPFLSIYWTLVQFFSLSFLSLHSPLRFNLLLDTSSVDMCHDMENCAAVYLYAHIPNAHFLELVVSKKKKKSKLCLNLVASGGTWPICVKLCCINLKTVATERNRIVSWKHSPVTIVLPCELVKQEIHVVSTVNPPSPECRGHLMDCHQAPLKTTRRKGQHILWMLWCFCNQLLATNRLFFFFLLPNC